MIRITVKNEQISCSWTSDSNEGTLESPWIRFNDPFDESIVEKIEWYLEDYLDYPYGVAPEKAERIESDLEHWGSTLYEIVFDCNDGAREIFSAATKLGLDKCEISICTREPKVLKLPWELMFAPDNSPLALSSAGMYRTLESSTDPGFHVKALQGKINVLMITARPKDSEDQRNIRSGIVARPVHEVIKPMRSRVFFKTLNPPTLSALREEIERKPGFYHVVHFDGHGQFASIPGRDGKQGILCFEKEDLSPHPVPAEEIATILQDGRIPLVLLNACKSGKEDDKALSSVATTLIRLGAKAVVAMGYSIYGDAARYFMKKLYESMLSGMSMSLSVREARREMKYCMKRKSSKGDVDLHDWMVPVLYQQSTHVSFAKSFLSGTPIENPSNSIFNFPLCGRHGFIGRDDEILELQRCFTKHNVVFLRGMVGIGKTSLASYWGNWLVETNGRNQAFYSSFAGGKNFKEAVNHVCECIVGSCFSQYTFEKCKGIVTSHLLNNDCFVVWDHFEEAAGFRAGDISLSSKEAQDFQGFLQSLRPGKSWILITGRQEVSWLRSTCQVMELKPMGEYNAKLLARQVLNNAGIDIATHSEENYFQLLKALNGHPDAISIFLPKLSSMSSEELLNLMTQDVETGQDDEEGKSMIALFSDVLHKLSAKARTNLPILGLFCLQTSFPQLNAFSSGARNRSEIRSKYHRLFGEPLNELEWKDIASEAEKAGIARTEDNSVIVHPALPWYLRQCLFQIGYYPNLDRSTNAHPIGFLDMPLMSLYSELAIEKTKLVLTGMEISINNTISKLFNVEESNLLRQLDVALRYSCWLQASNMLKAIGWNFRRAARNQEIFSLCKKVMRQVPDHYDDLSLNDEYQLLSVVKDIAFDIQFRIEGQNALPNARVLFEMLNKLHLSGEESYFEAEKLLKYAEEALGVHLLSKAESSATRAIEIAEFSRESGQIIRGYIVLAKVKSFQGIPQESVRFSKLGLEELGESGSKSSDRCLQLAFLKQQLAVSLLDHHIKDFPCQYSEEFRDSELLREALKCLDEAEKNFSTIGVEDQKANLLQARGRLYFQKSSLKKGLLDEAERFLKEALKINEKEGSRAECASQLWWLGLVADAKGSPEDAMMYSKKAHEDYKSTGNGMGFMHERLTFSRSEEAKGNLDIAFAAVEEALLVATNTGFDFMAATCHQDLGTIGENLAKRATDYEIKNFELNRAEMHYNEAIIIREGRNETSLTAAIHHQLGRVWMKRWNIEKATKYLKKGIDIDRQYEEKRGEALGHYELARMLIMCLDVNADREAGEHLAQAYHIFRILGDDDHLKITKDELCKVLKRLGEGEFKESWKRGLRDECDDKTYSGIENYCKSSEIHSTSS